MDYSQYEIYDFDSRSAFNISTGYSQRSYKQHWHSSLIVVYRFGIYGLGFLIGYFVLSHEEVMDRLGKYWLLLSITD